MRCCALSEQQAAARRRRDGLDDPSSFEGRVLLREDVRQLGIGTDVDGDGAGTPQRSGDVEADLGGLDLPGLAQVRFGDRVALVRSGVERGDLGTPAGLRAVLGHPLLDRGAPLAERPTLVPVDADDVRSALHDLAEADAEPLGQFPAQHRLVDAARGSGVGVEQRPERTRPLAVGAPGHVRDQDVAVQVRVQRPARPMPEHGRDQPVAFEADRATVSSAHDTGVLVEVGEGRIDRSVVGGLDGRSDAPITQSPQQGHGLRRRQRHVVRRPLRPRADPCPSSRVTALQQRLQISALDPARQTQGSGRSAVPAARLLGRLQVVVLDVEDHPDVVVGTVGAHRRDAHHDCGRPIPGPEVASSFGVHASTHD